MRRNNREDARRKGKFLLVMTEESAAIVNVKYMDIYVHECEGNNIPTYFPF
jgi:hypothetical protein